MALIILIVAITIFLLAIYRNQYWKRRGLQGPRLKPFFGSMLDLINPKFPPIFVINEWTKLYGNIFGYQHGWKNVLVISDPEIVHEILFTKFDCFSERRISPNISHEVNSTAAISLFASAGNRWKRLRSIINPVFSTSNLKQLFPILNNSAKQTVDLLVSADLTNDIDIIKYCREYSMDIIAILALGQHKSQQFKSGLVKMAVGVFSGFGASYFCHLSWVIPALGGLFGKIGTFCEIIGCFAFIKLLLTVKKTVMDRKKKRRENSIIDKSPDFINFFLSAESSDDDTVTKSKKHMTPDEIVAQCTVILLAGFETTANTLTLTFHYLAQNPAEQDKLREEIKDVCNDLDPTYDQLNRLKILNAFINEVLRLHPIGAFAVSRVCTKETTLKHLKIEPGTHLQIDILALHTDQTVWGPDSNEFKPERWLNKESIPLTFYFPFGGGKRSCIGKELAIIELKVLLVHVLQNIRVLPSTIKTESLKFRGLTTLCPVNVNVCLKKLE